MSRSQWVTFQCPRCKRLTKQRSFVIEVLCRCPDGTERKMVRSES